MRLFIYGILLLAAIMILMQACMSPVVFRERGTGKRCGCLVDDDVPSMGQCQRLKRDAVYDTVWVSTCN